VALPSGDDLALAITEPHVPAATTAQQLAVRLAARVTRVRSGRQRCRFHQPSRARPGGDRQAHSRARRLERICSVGRVAVGGVALPCGEDLALAIAEPHIPAATAARSLPPVLPQASHVAGAIVEGQQAANGYCGDS